MSKYFLVRLLLYPDKYDIHCYHVNGLESLAVEVTDAKKLGLNVVEGISFHDECDFKNYASQKGCLAVVKVEG